ncbi:MAG: alpha/beta hydrolase [Planctomycetaceae bacterium]
MRGICWGVLLCVGLFFVGSVSAGEPTWEGVEFAKVGEVSLKLDLYLPEGAGRREGVEGKTRGLPPLVVYVHGGAWRAGSRGKPPVSDWTSLGFAVASVDYRLSTMDRFPAQIHDIKAAIRYLRAHHERLQIDTSVIAIVGSSAGGHLAALVGVTNGDRELEGTVGDHLEQSSDVQAIVSYYGASNLETILSQSTPHGLSVRVPALELLLGGQPEKVVALAKQASPVTHVDKSDPPLLLVHGDQDRQMPVNQSLELQGAYEAVNRPVTLQVLHGSGHGGAEFYAPPARDVAIEFLNRHLRERRGSRDESSSSATPQGVRDVGRR